MKKKAKKPARRPVLRFVLWTAVFLVLAAAADQALMRLSAKQPLLRDFQDCYRDFRTRLLGRACPMKKPKAVPQETVKPKPHPLKTVEALIEQDARQPANTDRTYLYVDREGNLQFADSLNEVPPAYRSAAEPMTD